MSLKRVGHSCDLCSCSFRGFVFIASPAGDGDLIDAKTLKLVGLVSRSLFFDVLAWLEAVKGSWTLIRTGRCVRQKSSLTGEGDESTRALVRRKLMSVSSSPIRCKRTSECGVEVREGRGGVCGLHHALTRWEGLSTPWTGPVSA